MKKFLCLCILIILSYTSQSSICYSQSWKELSDSTKSYNEKRDLNSALKWARLALTKAEMEFGKTDSNYVSTLDFISTTFYSMGKIDSAIYYEENCLNASRSLYKEDHAFLAEIINNLGVFYKTIGDFKSAEPLYKEALEMRRRLFHGDHEELAVTINNVALLYHALGDFKKAEPLYKEALEMYRRIFKGDNTNLANSIMSMGFFYNAIGNYEQAEPYLKESVDMARRLYKEDNPYLASYINNFAVFFSNLGRFKESEPLLIEALEMNRRLYKDDNSNLARSLNSLATCYNSMGRYTEAEPLYKEALEMRRRLFKGDHPELANSINNMGSFYEDFGRSEQAETLYKEAIAMCRRLYKGDHPDLATKISNIALFFFTKGRYAEAEPIFKEALEMRRRIFKDGHTDLATIINNIASFYNDMGFYTDAEPLYKEALEMNRKIFKKDHPNLAGSLLSMAYYYDGRGRYTEAEPLLTAALQMNRRLYKGDHINLEGSINNMALFYKEKGRFDKAEPLFKEALEMSRRLFKNENRVLATSINNMAFFYEAVGRLGEAEPLLKEALDMRRRLYSVDHPDLANSINNMAGLLDEEGNHKIAEPLYKEALEMRKRLFKIAHPSLAQSIYEMAMFENDRENFTDAEALFKEALEMRRKLFKDAHPDLSKSINCMANYFEDRVRYIEAESLYAEGLKVNINILNNYFPSLSEKEKKQFWNTLSNDFEAFNNFAVKRYKENPSIISNMYDNQLYSKALLLNSSNRVKSRIMNSGDSLLIDKFRTWSDKKEFLVKLYKMTNDELKKKNFKIDSIENVANDLEKELTLKSEVFKQSYEKKKVNWKSIQTLLKPDEAAVEVVRFRYKDKNKFTDTIYYAFLIINEQTEEHPDMVVIETGNELENKYYAEYRNNTRSKTEDKKSFERYWSKLYEKTKGYKKIFFSADGVYNKLNPSTLMLPDGKFLIDIQDIQQVNTTKDLLTGYYQTKQESNIYNSALLIGNPNFSLSEEQVQQASRKIRGNKDEDKSYEPLASTRGINLTKLPGTEKEINDIAKFLKDKKWEVYSYLRDSALKTAVKTANNPRVLHIATHGLFLEDVKRESKGIFGFDEKKMIENPLLRSGLFFTGADNYLKKENPNLNDAEDNGLLTAYEAMNLDLDKTELVVLSACETGLGEIQNGEGVFGLRRAFQQAGAKTIMMSLWKVNDDATQQLMSSFYKNWVTGMTKRDAFSKAQQEVRSKYKDPYYWGAFVMVGE